MGLGVILGLIISTEEGSEMAQPSPLYAPMEEGTAPPLWDVFIEALIQVESGGDHKAVGRANDVGVLQITPIMVKEANRILGEDAYSLDDRYSREKSVEMFNIVQNHHNPDKDVMEALRIWNPRAPKGYAEKVWKNIDKLLSLSRGDNDVYMCNAISGNSGNCD